MKEPKRKRCPRCRSDHLMCIGDGYDQTAYIECQKCLFMGPAVAVRRQGKRKLIASTRTAATLAWNSFSKQEPLDVTYLVMAYRWGRSNLHHYCVGATGQLHRALELAHGENEDRTGKYATQVTRFENGKPIEPVAYFPSTHGEPTLSIDPQKYAWDNFIGSSIETALALGNINRDWPHLTPQLLAQWHRSVRLAEKTLRAIEVQKKRQRHRKA